MTSYDEICPSCDRTDSTHWVSSNPPRTWACRRGHEWTISIEPVPAEVPR